MVNNIIHDVTFIGTNCFPELLKYGTEQYGRIPIAKPVMIKIIIKHFHKKGFEPKINNTMQIYVSELNNI